MRLRVIVVGVWTRSPSLQRHLGRHLLRRRIGSKIMLGDDKTIEGEHKLNTPLASTSATCEYSSR